MPVPAPTDAPCEHNGRSPPSPSPRAGDVPPPQFEDALKDLDDALNLVHMFAALPAKGRVSVKTDKGTEELSAKHIILATGARAR